ncbi:MAG: signal peptidase I [bacterium]|nr:signal peptidase I [bacterium]
MENKRPNYLGSPYKETQSSHSAGNKPPSRLKEEIISWVKIIILAACIAFFLNTFLIANSMVPSGSMENTIPTNSRIMGSRLTYKFFEPERGDISIFLFPDDESRYYVKRIIGLPGETVEIRQGKIYINGSETPLEEPYLKEEWLYDNDGYTFEIPEDSYLMLGDNRNWSQDARYWENTYVHKDKLLAKVYFEYFPSLKWLDNYDKMTETQPAT